jgi:hypothetical protein
MQSVATRTRVHQVTIIVAVSFLFYEYANWVEGFWVILSTVVVAGPFSTFLTFEKAKDRFLGTLVGLLFAAGLEYFLRFNPSMLPPVAVAMAFIGGFMMTRPYKYFVIIVTIAVCLAYVDMNIPYTSFGQISFLIDRGLGVFVGVLIFFALQRFVFGDGNSKLELLEESHTALGNLEKTLTAYKANPTLSTAYECAADIFANTKDLKSYVESAPLVFSEKTMNPETRYAKQVLLLNNRAAKLLIDKPTVDINRMDRLLHIIALKLDQ